MDQLDRPALRFGFVPYSLEANEYGSRMVAILERMGSVQAIAPPTLRSVLSALFGEERLDAAFVSWFENRMLREDGTISVLRAGKVLLRTLALRAHARKLVFIRHNRFPHATALKHRRLAQKLVDLYERWLFESSLTHSPVEATSARLYCPHPLYETASTIRPPTPLAAFSTGTFFVVFGRIEPYKQLEQLIRAFPRAQRLVICGRCADPEYLAALQHSAPENVTVLHGFLPDADAQWLIRRSSGVVISHASEDMIVSATFFYALSLAQRVYAVETPFLDWASSTLGRDIVNVFPNVESLCQALEAAAPGGDARRQVESAIQHFGDDTIARHIEDLLARIDLHVRPLESSSGEKSHALCSSQRGDGALRS